MRSASFHFLFVTLLCRTSGYNFDSKNVEVISGPQLGSHFGYSLILKEDGSVLAGAPKGKRGTVGPGVLYTCWFRNGTCQEHRINAVALEGPYDVKEGALFSMTMDASSATDSIIVCAPRLAESKFYYTNGACYSLKDGRKIAYLSNKRDQIGMDPSPYYKYAFGEMGFSLKYLKGFRSNFLLGAPGLHSWSGGLLLGDDSNSRTMISSKATFGFSPYDYFGYSVDTGTFKRFSMDVWGVSGAPRAGLMLGEVKLFDVNSFRTMQTLIGEQVGSYFGASLLAVDVNGDGADDLLVGAPTYSFGLFDEGCVYFYRNKGNGSFHDAVIMMEPQQGARFGSTIADLGDLNHDFYKDVAISAPYENDQGAIYIYLGSPEGLIEKFSQKLQPEDFSPKVPVGGFGIGISKAVDVDGNSYKDIAVGAYATSQVVLIRSQAIMEYGAGLKAFSKEFSTNESDEVIVQFCIRAVSDVQHLVPVETDLKLILDDRAISDFYHKAVNVSKALSCLNTTLKLTKNIFGATDPIAVTMVYKQIPRKTPTFCSNCPVVSPLDPSRTTLEIPVAHGCGSDAVCSTQLSISGSFNNMSNLVLGANDTVPLTVAVRNEGEPAYLCQMVLVLPDDVFMAEVPTGCTLDQQRLECLVGNSFTKLEKWDATFNLDVSRVESDVKELKVGLNVSSLGKETAPRDNEVNVTLPVVLDVRPQVNGKALPEQYADVFHRDGASQDVSLKHTFLISNLGKSPYDVRATLLVPSKVKGVDVAEIQAVEVSTNDEPSTICSSNGTYVRNRYEGSSTQGDRTLVVTCGTTAFDVVCVQVTCTVGRLASSRHIAIVALKIKVKPKIFEVSTKEDVIVFGSTINADVNGARAWNSTSTMFFVTKAREPVPSWVMVASSIAGVVVVLVIIVVLWKCDFFRRKYKERILTEEEGAIIDANEADSD